MIQMMVKVVIAVVALYGAYMLYDAHAPAEWPRSTYLDALMGGREAEAPPPAPVVAEVVGPSLHRVVCPTCQGETRLTYADGRGANHVYPCPICNGLGTRTVQVSPGQKICPDCLGMGVTERRESRQSQTSRQTAPGRGKADAQIRSTRCLRCNTSGVITSAGGKKPEPTPGVQTPRPAR